MCDLPNQSGGSPPPSTAGVCVTCFSPATPLLHIRSLRSLRRLCEPPVRLLGIEPAPYFAGSPSRTAARRWMAPQPRNYKEQASRGHEGPLHTPARARTARRTAKRCLACCVRRAPDDAADDGQAATLLSLLALPRGGPGDTARPSHAPTSH